MTYISPSVTKILGYTPEEMKQGKDFERLTKEGDTNLRKFLEYTASEEKEKDVYKRQIKSYARRTCQKVCRNNKT